MIQFRTGQLTDAVQKRVQTGFNKHSEVSQAPSYDKKSFHWLVYDDQKRIIGVLTAELVWGWLYIDELWMEESARGQGFGSQLMAAAEAYVSNNNLSGLWLWTQSWQAAQFYEKLDYQEFTRFPDFPPGYSRIGFRKLMKPVGTFDKALHIE